MNEYNEWSEETKDTSIKALKGYHETLLMLKGKIEYIEKEVETLNSQKKEIETKILTIMKEENLPQFKSEFGTISIKNNKSVAQPETIEEKLRFFEYLKEQGLFEAMVSVNSRTLTSWVGKEVEAKEKQGVFGWVPPGLKAISTYPSLSIRK
jgi:predicted  nucleic acid-binding Zn-ribbon protein